MLDLKYPMYYKEKKRGKIQRDDVHNVMADEVDNRVFPIICKRNFIKEHVFLLLFSRWLQKQAVALRICAIVGFECPSQIKSYFYHFEIQSSDKQIEFWPQGLKHVMWKSN